MLDEMLCYTNMNTLNMTHSGQINIFIHPCCLRPTCVRSPWQNLLLSGFVSHPACMMSPHLSQTVIYAMHQLISVNARFLQPQLISEAAHALLAAGMSAKRRETLNMALLLHAMQSYLRKAKKSEDDMVEFFTKVMDRKQKYCIVSLCQCEAAFPWERQLDYEYDLFTVKFSKSECKGIICSHGHWLNLLNWLLL